MGLGILCLRQKASCNAIKETPIHHHHQHAEAYLTQQERLRLKGVIIVSETTGGTAIATGLNATALNEEHISAYKRAHKGKLTDAQIQEGANSLSEALTAAGKQLATQTKYSANGGISFTFAWVHIGITAGGKNCQGDGGGAYSLGGGYFWGKHNTADIDRLHRDTVSFQVNVTPVYANINFFDGSSNFLGHFEGGGACLGGGTGG